MAPLFHPELFAFFQFLHVLETSSMLHTRYGRQLPYMLLGAWQESVREMSVRSLGVVFIKVGFIIEVKLCFGSRTSLAL